MLSMQRRIWGLLRRSPRDGGKVPGLGGEGAWRNGADPPYRNFVEAVADARESYGVEYLNQVAKLQEPLASGDTSASSS